MTDTIELLESIGTDASLRHSSGADLARTLAGMQASEGLQLAAMSGDRSHLVHELDPKQNEPPHTPINGGYGGGGDGDEDQRDQEREDNSEA